MFSAFLVWGLFCYGINSQSSYRLPSTIAPISYNLTLFPHLFDDFTFDGWVSIQLNISKEHVSSTGTNFNIQLNKGADLTIDETDINVTIPLLSLNPLFSSLIINDTTEVSTIYFDATNEEIFNLMDNLTLSYVIGHFYCSYSSPLIADARAGFYLSSYDYNNITIHGTGTQMEPTYTRRALPCFDEPHWRSIYYITYITPINSIALANMDVNTVTNLPDTSQYQCDYISSIDTNNLCKIVTFLPTPPMPSYLLAFVIGDYDHIDHIELNKQLTTGEIINFTQTVYMRLGTAQYFTFALNNSLIVLKWFEEAFNLTYNLNKLDSVALVQYGGAMENWGLVIYGPGAILRDTSTQLTDQQKRSTIGLIGHEFAHQWFGNDVTLEWWDQLWIQEGYARYFEYIVGNATRPDLPFDSTFYWGVWENAFGNSESVFTFPPVRENVVTQSEISAQFSGSLTYAKGACIAKLMNKYVGDRLFYNALNEYLNTYYYGVANTDKLTEIFNPYVNEADNDYSDPMLASKMFGSYANQAGFPILFVEFTSMDDSGISVTLRQQRMVLEGPTFYTNPNQQNPYYNPTLSEEFSKQLWYIPFRIQVSNGNIIKNIPTNTSQRSFIISGRSKTDGKEYYIFNPNTDYFFRVAYDEKSFKLIIDNFEYIPYLSQYAIVSDQWKLTKSNYVSAVLYLQFIEKIATPSIINLEYWSFFWNTIITSLTEIDSLLCEYQILSPTNSTLRVYRNNFRKFVREELNPMWEEVDEWNIADDMDSDVVDIKTKLISLFIQLNDSDIITVGTRMLLESNYQNLTGTGGQISDIDSNVLPQVFKAAFASLNQSTFDIILNEIYPQSSDTQQNWIIDAIGLTYSNEDLLQKGYDFVRNVAANNKKSRGYQNLRMCSGRGLVWNNMMANDYADWLSLQSINQNSAKSLPQPFASLGRYNGIYDFYVEQGLLSDATEDTNKTLETMYMNAQWLIQNENALLKYLDEYINGSDSDDDIEKWVPLVLYGVMAVVITCCIAAFVLYICRRKSKAPNYATTYNEIDNSAGYGAA